jgi:hypothetical protein
MIFAVTTAKSITTLNGSTRGTDISETKVFNERGADFILTMTSIYLQEK